MLLSAINDGVYNKLSYRSRYVALKNLKKKRKTAKPINWKGIMTAVFNKMYLITNITVEIWNCYYQHNAMDNRGIWLNVSVNLNMLKSYGSVYIARRSYGLKLLINVLGKIALPDDNNWFSFDPFKRVYSDYCSILCN